MEPNITSVVDHDAGQHSPEGEQGSPMPSEETKPVESSELPEGVSERTQAEFEKLKEANRRLKEELDKTVDESVYDIFRAKPEATVNTEYKPQAPTVSMPQPSSYVDEYGNVDVDKFNAAVAQANARAEEAARRAQQALERIQRSEEEKQEREAYAKHSYLNPKSPDFDKTFYKLVRNEVVANYANGQESDLVAIADEISSFYKPTNVEAEKEKAVSEYKETQSKKSASGSPKGTARPTPTDTTEDLRERSMQGDEEALARRLKNLGI